MQAAEQPADANRPGLSVSGRRQAMDWSLVLLSQGIESTPLQDPVTGQWLLGVAEERMSAARDTIRLYERENRAWPLRQALPWAGGAFDWAAVAWVFLIAVFFMLQTQPGSMLNDAGVSRTGLVRAGEWWRPLTATCLHADLGHLALNSVFGLLLLGLAMGRFGSGLALLVTLLAGALANVMPLMWREDWAGSLGASGVVMAALGLLAAGAVMHQVKRRQLYRLLAQGLGGGVMLFVLLGTSASSDIPAHAAGFLFGVLLGLPLALLPLTTAHRARWNLVAGGAYCVLLCGAWILALTRGMP